MGVALLELGQVPLLDDGPLAETSRLAALRHEAW
jgi:hypothetical protein